MSCKECKIAQNQEENFNLAPTGRTEDYLWVNNQ